MNTNQKFAVFCAKRCLHLWEAPIVVIKWLNNPKQKTALEAVHATHITLRETAYTFWISRAPKYATAEYAADAASYAASCFVWLEGDAAENAAYAAANAANAAGNAASKALDISVSELRQEFVHTWSDKDLSTTDSYWIEYATIEILNRAAN